MHEMSFTPAEAVELLGKLDKIHDWDRTGWVTFLVPDDLTPEVIAILKRRSSAPGPRRTSAQVRELLQTLQGTWEREGPFGSERKDQIVAELHSKWDRQSSIDDNR